MLERLTAIKPRFPFVRDVRGKGLMIGVELADPKTGADSDANRSSNPIENARGIRFKVRGDSDPNRSPNPMTSDH
jgi:4-aminobutyrate aminotransferase-like enzyme